MGDIIFITRNPKFYQRYWEMCDIYKTVCPSHPDLSLGLQGAKIVDFDIETTGLHPWKADPLLTVLKFDNVPSKIFVIDNTRRNGYPLQKILDKMDLTKVVLRGANLKFDLKFYYYNHPSPQPIRMIYDTMIVEQSLTRGTDASCGLDATAQRYLGIEPMQKNIRNEFPKMESEVAYFYPRHIYYAAEDVDHIGEIQEHQMRRVNEEGMRTDVMSNMSTVIMTAQAEARGIKLDVDRWVENANAQEKEMYRTQRVLDEMLSSTGLNMRERKTQSVTQGGLFDGCDVEMKNPNKGNVNYNSGKQLVSVFEQVGWPIPVNKQEDNKISFGKEALSDYLIDYYGTPQYEFMKVFKEYQYAKKRATTYGKDFLKHLVVDTGAVHTEFMTNRTSTGRFSSKDPNMQNQPNTKDFRHCYVAREGFEVLTADFSSAELRILADFSGDTKMIEILDSDGDLHSYVAQPVFRFLRRDDTLIVSKEENSDLRTRCKNVIFSKVYGSGVKKTALLLDCTVDEAEHAEVIMRSLLPEAFAYLDEKGNEALRNGYVLFNDVFRSRRYFPEVHSGFQLSAGEEGSVMRRAKNAPIQGTNADMIKLALHNIKNWIMDNGYWGKIFFLLQVHDELVFELSDELHKPAVAKEIQRIMDESANVFFNRITMKTAYDLEPYWTK